MSGDQPVRYRLWKERLRGMVDASITKESTLHPYAWLDGIRRRVSLVKTCFVHNEQKIISTDIE